MTELFPVLQHTIVWGFKVLFAAWILWAATCLFSPYMLCRGRRKLGRYVMSPQLQLDCGKLGIALYECDELEGYAFSGYLGFKPVIIFNSVFLRYATLPARDFVSMHELGHHMLGHVQARLLARIFFFDRFSELVRTRLAFTESEANEYAEERTGHSPAIVWGPIVVSEAGGTGQEVNEEKA